MPVSSRRSWPGVSKSATHFAAYAFQLCARAVARVFPASGAHGIYSDAAPQRALRDTQVLTAHIVADWDMSRESYSRWLLGLPIDDPVF